MNIRELKAGDTFTSEGLVGEFKFIKPLGGGWYEVLFLGKLEEKLVKVYPYLGRVTLVGEPL